MQSRIPTRFLSFFCFLLLFFLIGFNRSQAFTVEIPDEIFPAEVEQVSRSCIVTNTNKNMIAIVVYAKTRAQNINGREIRKNADSDFFIIPRQLILQPGERQIVSLTWKGQSDPEIEKAFRVVFEELPIDLKKTGKRNGVSSGKINLVRKMVYSVYVRPKNAMPEVVISNIRPVKSKGRTLMEIIFENKGSAHKILRDVELVLTSEKDKTKTVDYKPRFKARAFNVLAGSKLKQVVNWPDAVPVGEVSATYISRNL